VVAVTLPEEVVEGLRAVNPDLAWAIVTLFEKTTKRHKIRPTAHGEAELIAVGGTRSLIVVPKQLFQGLNLPGVSILPFHDDRGFLALQPGRGVSDLVLAVDDRLHERSLGASKAAALRRLRTQLQRWRSSRQLRCDTRSIIVVERRRSGRTTRRS
jgi:hypothetical protein